MEPHLDPETPPAPDPTLPPAAPAAPVPSPPASTSKPDTAKRFIAKFIDGVIASVLFWIVNAIVPGWTAGLFVGGLVAAAYWLVCDGLELDFMKHRSLGKKIMKLSLVRNDGKPMDIEASVKRNWMFTLGYFYNAFLLGVGSSLAAIVGLASFALGVYEIYKVLTDSQGRRWGDELAGTKVVESDT